MNDDIKKQDVVRRILDWKTRIAELYKNLESDLDAITDIRIDKTRYVIMHEELMRKFNLPSEKLPIFDIYKKKQLAVTIKPVGLWVIGANGRLDILTSKGSYIVVDQANQGSVPKWMVFSPKDNQKGKILSPNFIIKILDVA